MNNNEGVIIGGSTLLTATSWAATVFYHYFNDRRKAPIEGIQDFNTTFSNLELSVADYETLPAETLLVNAVELALKAIYGVDNVDVIAI
jgi:hypothetical protein